MSDLSSECAEVDEAENTAPANSVAMTLFERGDYKAARQELTSATEDESVFLARALAWDGYLTLSIGVFLVIWLSAVYATAS